MRIISGRLGGRSIPGPPGSGVRPAMARTREALFSMLEARGLEWPDCRVLDLFAGSGSLGFECLSRGAAFAAFVDNSREQCAALAKAAAELGVSVQTRIFCQDAGRFLRKQALQGFSLVFVDPPYRRNHAGPALNFLAANGWLLPGAFVTAEIENGSALEEPAGLEPCGERLFGQTLLRIWKKA